MIITISGTPGSGKSTIGKRLAAYLNYRRYDMGALMREDAHDRGMSLSEYHRVTAVNPRGDNLIDAFQRRIGRTKKRAVVEGRLSFHFIPKSLKIFLSVSTAVGARRIWKQLQHSTARNEGPQLRTLAQVAHSLARRMNGDRQRYLRYYGVNPFLKRHYDLWLDTSKLTPDAVFRQVRDFVVENLRRQSNRSSIRIKPKKNRH